jgi:HEAT repeat protein
MTDPEVRSEVNTVLSKFLLEGVDVHRCAAARALGKIADTNSVGDLKKALLDEDPGVRSDAATALGAIGAEGCAEALMENLLRDPCFGVKMAAITALVQMRHRPVVPVLNSLVVSRSDDIAWDEDDFSSEGWDSRLDIQLMAIQGLAELGAEEAVPAIVAVLDSETGQDISETAVSALARLGWMGAGALSNMMAVGDIRRRRRIAVAVSACSGPHLDALRERCLGDESAEVRLPVATHMAQQTPADPRLEPLFDDPDAAIRVAMLNHAGPGYPGKVRQGMDDPDPAVRVAALGVLASCPDLIEDERLPDTVRIAISGDSGVAKQAAFTWVALVGKDALRSLGGALINSGVPIAFRIGSITSLLKIGRGSVPYLLRVAGDENRQLRLATLTALADFAARDAIWPNPAGEGLLAALKRELVEEPEPEPIALSGQEPHLMELSKQQGIRQREISLEDMVAPHLDVPRVAAHLLGDVVHPDVTAHLIAALADDDGELHQAALHSLVRHGGKLGVLPGYGLAPLLTCIDGQNPELRHLAVRALGWLDREGIDATLYGLLSDDDSHIRLEAVRALDLRGVADDRILACLKDENSGVRLAAATSLARHRGPELASPLVEFAFRDDGMYCRDVGRILGAFARKPAARILLGILGDDSHKRHWLVAIEALAEMYQQPEPAEELKVA